MKTLIDAFSFASEAARQLAQVLRDDFQEIRFRRIPRKLKKRLKTLDL